MKTLSHRIADQLKSTADRLRRDAADYREMVRKNPHSPARADANDAHRAAQRLEADARRFGK